MPEPDSFESVTNSSEPPETRARKARGEFRRVLGIAARDPQVNHPNTRDMPLPRNWNTVFLGILTLIAVLTCLYVARDIVLPVVLAMVLKLLFQPLVKLLERIRIPKAVGALVSIILLLGVFVGLGALLSNPASRWAGQLPQAWPMLQQRFAALRPTIARLDHLLSNMGVHFGASDSILSHPVGMVTAVFSGTGTIASNLLETLLVLFYLLVFGETFLLRLVEVLPHSDDKRDAVEISMHMERDLSAYLLTITIINAVVGCATALVMWICGVPGPVLWGVVAFCLNFVPILGPFVGILLFLAVGIVTAGFAWISILPACLYFGIHVAEGEIITPMLVASRFTINPVAVMLSLIFWYWMWGVAGAILAVPMLAILKIICDRLRPFRAFGHLLEG
ncbi:MAG: AI-2E family transporter [Mycobacterium sp.]